MNLGGEMQVGDGLVWTADVVGFSLLDAQRQVEVIRFLSDWLVERRLFKRLERNRDYIVHGTGDGFLVTLLHGEDLPWQLISGAAALVRASVARREPGPGPAFRVRQSLHVGEFAYPVPLFGGLEAVGDGLNRGSRVSTAAGPDQIYVSEDFVTHLVGTYGRAAVSRRLSLHPPLRSPPYTLPVKHGDTVRIRLVRRPGVDSESLSPRLLRLYETQRRLTEELELILQATKRSVTQGRGGLNDEVLQLRASIWEVVGGVLVATPRRLGWEPPPGTSMVSTRRLSPPNGPLARAATAGRPVVNVDLSTDPGAGTELLGRWPGAIVAIPFAFGPDGVRGVICIDMAPPMTEDRGVLDVLAGVVHEREGEHVGALMQLRRG